MNRTPVNSSNVSSVGYDPTSLTLEVEFHGGAVYQYFDVPIMTSSEIQSLYTWRKGLSNSENVVVVG